MKKLLHVFASILLAFGTGSLAFGQYTQVDLVSNAAGEAPTKDSLLVNPWGISRGPTGNLWISDNVTGVSTLYAGAGVKNQLTVTIPSNPNSKGSKIGSPTGTIFNGSTKDFILANGLPAEFIFCTIDGSIAAWNSTIALAAGTAPPSTHAVTVAATKDGSIYTGLTTGLIDGNRFLFAANSSKGRIDVYDNSFHLVQFDPNPAPGTGPFVDANIPSSFVPFNVQAIGDNIVVTYAMAGSGGVAAGPGLGYVDIFNTLGQLQLRLDDLLIGQFGAAGTTENAGTITAYNPTTGHFDGQLKDATGKPIVITGLWDITFGNAGAPAPGPYDPAGAPGAELFFTAGIDSEKGGLFGYLTPVATDLIDGNDQ